MRITQSTMFQSAMRGIRTRLASLASAQEEAATLRKVNTVSDQPVDASEILRLDAQLRDVEQFRRNAASAAMRLEVEDTVLGSMRDLVARASNIGFGVSQVPVGDPLRVAAIQDLQLIQEQLVALGNTRLGDEYVFGGAETDSPPFIANGAYLGDTVVRRTEIEDGFYIETVHPGDPSMQGAMLAVRDLMLQLATGTANTIQVSSAAVSASGQQLLEDQTEAGIRQGVVAKAVTRLGQRANVLLDRRDVLRESDPAEALLKATTAQTALERAYAVAGRVLQTSLLDFLR